MSDLILPQNEDGPRVAPRLPEDAAPLIKAEYDKAKWTWGIPNNLVFTMGCHPMLALTEVDYANSFIFDEGTYMAIPRPGAVDSGETISFPAAGFIDRVTKELVISVVSLMNKSRYSITHHTLIAYGTLAQLVEGSSPDEKAARAEAMLLNLVDGDGKAIYRSAEYQGGALYSEMQLALLDIAVKSNQDPHSVTDEDMQSVRELLRNEAVRVISKGPLAQQFNDAQPDEAYVNAYVDAMVVEITWCMAHFGGLLNRWFVLMKVKDEEFEVNPENGNSFIDEYNQNVPGKIKERNNQLLGPDGWGGNA